MNLGVVGFRRCHDPIPGGMSSFAYPRSSFPPPIAIELTFYTA